MGKSKSVQSKNKIIKTPLPTKNEKHCFKFSDLIFSKLILPK